MGNQGTCLARSVQVPAKRNQRDRELGFTSGRVAQPIGYADWTAARLALRGFVIPMCRALPLNGAPRLAVHEG